MNDSHHCITASSAGSASVKERAVRLSGTAAKGLKEDEFVSPLVLSAAHPLPIHASLMLRLSGCQMPWSLCVCVESHVYVPILCAAPDSYLHLESPTCMWSQCHIQPCALPLCTSTFILNMLHLTSSGQCICLLTHLCVI